MENINKKYNDIYPDSEVFVDEGLEIYINGRHSVEVAEVKDDAEAIEMAETLLEKFDFSFFLEFQNKKELDEFINL